MLAAANKPDGPEEESKMQVQEITKLAPVAESSASFK